MQLVIDVTVGYGGIMEAQELTPTGTEAGYTYPLVVREIRSAGLTNAEIAAVTGVRERQVQNWAAGSSRPRDESRDRLVDMHYLVQQLATVYTAEGAEIWLHRRNVAFDGQRPVDLLEDGDFKPVLDAVRRLKSGAS